MPVRHRAVAGVVVLAALAGCGGATGSAVSPEPALAGTARTSGPGLVLPLDAYGPSPREQRTIDRAEAIAFDRCMARLGFPATGPHVPVTPADPHRDRYMLADARAAHSRGYHPPAAEQAAADAAARRTLPADYVTAAGGRGAARLHGVPVPRGGCAAEAAARLRTDASGRDLAVVTRLRDWGWDRAQRDSRVLGVFARWSACMAEAGYAYRTPLDANDDPAFAADRPTRAEIATAVADVACKTRVGVVDTWAAVEAAYQRVAIAGHGAELRRARAVVSAQLAAAAAVG
jgi:hypothetical protein